jgi:hypothetical protein
MAFPCNKNPLLDALEAKKKALKDKLADLPSLGTGALADIQSLAEDAAQGLKDLLPEIPEIPNFQDQLDSLKKDILSGIPDNNKLLAFQKKWGGLVDDLEATLSVFNDPLKLLDFKICDQEKVEAKTGPNGELIKQEPEIEAVLPVNQAQDPDPKQEITQVGGENIAKNIQQDRFTASDITTYEFNRAHDSLRQQVNAKILDRLEDFEEKSSAQKKIEEGTGDKYIKELNDAVPAEWIKQNPHLPLIEWFLDPDSNGNNVVPKDSVNARFVGRIKRAYGAIVRAHLAELFDIVVDTMSGRKTIDGQDRWTGSDWNPQFKKELQYFWYTRFGFGLKTYKSEYVNLSKAMFVSEYAKARPNNIVSLSKGSYNSCFLFQIQNLTKLVKKESVGGTKYANKELKDIHKDLVEKMFAEADTTEIGREKVLLVIAAYERKVKFADLPNLPEWEDFVPKGLGNGRLQLWENSDEGQGATNAQVSKYTEANFVPHFMYKKHEPTGKIITLYANRYQEHEQYALQGYVHEKPN